MFWSEEFCLPPPNSLDLNPFNFYVWSLAKGLPLKQEINVASLCNAVEVALKKMYSDVLKRACKGVAKDGGCHCK